MAASKVKAHARKCKQGNAQVYKCYSYREKTDSLVQASSCEHSVKSADVT